MTNQQDFHTIVDGVPTGLLINGEFRDASDGGTFTLRDPATDSALVEVAAATEDDAQQALELAVSAAAEWAATPARERGEILRKVFDFIHRDEKKLTYLQSLEMGRALSDSKAEVAYGAEFFRWFSEEAVRTYGDYRHAPGGNARIIELQQPVGPVLAITPWNFPLAMGARKIAPALAAGCPIIIKPASKTPLTMLYLGKLLVEAGVPAGVIAVLPTGKSSHVSALLSDDRLRKFTFTGSTEVGQMLAAKAAATSMNVSLELGGNAPFVVLEDADVNKAIEAVKVAKLRNGGQVCIAANRFIVHQKHVDAFVDGVAEIFNELKIGPGTDETTNIGPLALREQQETVRNLVDDAVERGAKVVIGGKIPDLGGEFSTGYFYEPTVLRDVPVDADVVRKEIFGPVVAVVSVDEDNTALELANDTKFGLAAYVFSENLGTALQAAERIESGMVAVNKGALSDPSAAFGGVKQSGLGREGGKTGIDEYLETKFISIPD